jgi:DnaJ-class molecular chaperone
MNNYYRSLGLTKDEVDRDADALKRAYKKRALEFHPDKNPDKGEQFQRMASAFRILSNPDLRTVVDVFGNDVDRPEEVLQRVKNIFPHIDLSTSCELVRDILPNIFEGYRSSTTDLVELSMTISENERPWIKAVVGIMILLIWIYVSR